MNMLQKNPRDPKHKEYHDGEYEYWPVKAKLAGKAIDIPAALLNGLGLLAAAAAAVLVAMALLNLYTQSAPRYITENSAVVNVNVYNNVDNLEVRYRLFLASDEERERVLQEGMLEKNEDTLELKDLSPGTKYVLEYDSLKDGQWEYIGEFAFCTPGDPGDATEPTIHPATGQTEPEAAETEPVTPSTVETTVPEETVEETTEETIEETTEETRPPVIWYPPEPDTPTKPTEPETEPTEPTEPETEPSEPTEPETEPTEPTTEPTEPAPVPVAQDVTIDEVQFHETEVSGDENAGYYAFRQTHSFANIPDGGYTVEILQNGEEITGYSAYVDGSGNLVVEFTGNQIAIGEASETTVTVVWEDGTEAVSTHSMVTPSMEDVALNVTKNADNTHTFTITVTANADSTYALAFETLLYLTYEDYTGVSVELQQTGAGIYTGSYTTTITSTETEEEAIVHVAAIWDLAGMPSDVTTPQSGSAYFYYEP